MVITGDSLGVLSRNGIAHPLSDDHKPLQHTESIRIIQAGGFVSSVGRINGNLNVSRSLGDLKYKQVEQVGAHEQVRKCMKLNDSKKCEIK